MDREDIERYREIKRHGGPRLPVGKPTPRRKAVDARPADKASAAPQRPEDAPPPRDWVHGLFDETLRRIGDD